MLTQHQTYPAALLELVAEAEAAARQVPPLWPLATSVAVNPYLGQAEESLPITAARLARVAGAPVTRPRAEIRAEIAAGAITDADLAAALEAAPRAGRPGSVGALKAAAGAEAPAPRALPTVADLAADVTGTDWPGLIADRIGAWAAGYFDAGQALWAAPGDGAAYTAWRDFALRDLTAEINGLSGFAAHVAGAPASPWRALGRAAERLGIGPEAAPTAFHRLLMDMGGWAQLARQRMWEAEKTGGRDPVVTDLLAIRLLWDEALFLRHGAAIADRWAETVAAHAAPLTPSADQTIDCILQAAAERAAERQLGERLAAPAETDAAADRPAFQAAFCIDVRSEVIRRALEAADDGAETLGVAGFFLVGVAHNDVASDVVENRLPVLLAPGLASAGMAAGGTGADQAQRIRDRAKRAWGRFKLAAVSSFAFVEATGPVYAGKLLRDALNLPHGGGDGGPAPALAPDVPLASRVAAAAGALRAMSLTEGFAPVVLLAGHGAHVTNNPHESALQCGACGGYSGEVNARLLAGLLNAPEVRAGLAGEGIEIPDDTVFLGGLHDTVTDRVRLYEQDLPAGADRAALTRLRRALDLAAAEAGGERAARLPRAAGAASLPARGHDWAELRPEWGLAGCDAFIAAPRGRTAGRDLGGRVFLHSYDWEADAGFKGLELIMTAPVVVASWISLQYYGSAVAPDVFGGGNKLLHNVTGGIGVVEGNGGTLRAGLPWQSVHDGERLMHKPHRLKVAIEAPREAMTDVLDAHPELAALFDNGWLTLFAMDGAGRLAWRYDGARHWAAVSGAETGARTVAAE